MYLIIPEFKRFIQEDNKNQVINNDPSILIDAILDSQDVARENLVQKYLIDEELSDTNIYDPTVIYNGGDRIYLDAPGYNNSPGLYALGSLTSNAKVVYKNISAITVPEAFNPARWQSLGAQYSIWYVTISKPIFDVASNYSVGSQVFRLGKIYTCLISTVLIDHETLLQAYQYQNVPLKNIFPEDPTNGLKYWGAGTAVTAPAGTFPTGFTNGDNRARNLVRHMIAISLYIIHDRIAPRNIPILREQRYKEAIRWLKDASEGNITIDIAKIQPRSGGRIRWGGNIKNINSY
jgi:hypothetical protein